MALFVGLKFPYKNVSVCRHSPYIILIFCYTIPYMSKGAKRKHTTSIPVVCFFCILCLMCLLIIFYVFFKIVQDCLPAAFLHFQWIFIFRIE